MVFFFSPRCSDLFHTFSINWETWVAWFEMGYWEVWVLTILSLNPVPQSLTYNSSFGIFLLATMLILICYTRVTSLAHGPDVCWTSREEMEWMWEASKSLWFSIYVSWADSQIYLFIVGEYHHHHWIIGFILKLNIRKVTWTLQGGHYYFFSSALIYLWFKLLWVTKFRRDKLLWSPQYQLPKIHSNIVAILILSLILRILITTWGSTRK